MLGINGTKFLTHSQSKVCPPDAYVDADSYLLELSRYVVLNPLRARMVKQLRHWKWSSYSAMTGKVRTPDWLETDWILGHFGKQRKVSVRWTHLALRLDEEFRTVDTQHGSNSLIELN